MGKLAAFRRLNSADRRLYLEAAFFLTASRFVILAMPYSRVKYMLRSREGVPAEDQEQVTHIGRVVNNVARHVPWQCLCLVQALAGRWMLARRKIEATIYVGVAKDEEQDLLSHAWLCSGDVYITGEEGHERFHIITDFSESSTS